MLLLIAITVISLFTINSSAADEVDYNRSFAINIDGEYTYYSYSFLSNPTWEDYIRYFNEQNRTCDFVIVGEYVAYKNNLLFWQNSYVNKTDNIRAAAGSGIYKPDDFPLIQVNDDQLVFHAVFTYFNVTFQYLSDNFEEFSYVSTKYGDLYATYNGKVITSDVNLDVGNGAVNILDFIDYTVVYKLEEKYCNHLYVVIMMTNPTCNYCIWSNGCW